MYRWNRKANFCGRLGNEIIQILVGPEENAKLFTVHKKLLLETIPAYEPTLAKALKESQDGTACFPEEHVGEFDLLLSWLYTGKLR